MKLTRLFALLAVLVLVSSATVASAVAQSSGGGKLTATEVGVTKDEIRIAVIADVDNQFAPGLFKGSPDAVEAWAKSVNRKGGLAGRDVVVDFIDSHLSANDARNAFIKACAEDFAVVGTGALFLNNVSDIEQCVDEQGVATGLPDLAVVATETVQQCSPTTFSINPPNLVCDTLDQHPQTYRGNVGRSYYYEQKYGKDLHGAYIYSSDLKSANDANHASMDQMQARGIAADQEVNISGTAVQSAYTPIVRAMQQAGSNYAQSGSAYTTTVALRKEAALQGLTDPKIVWDCTIQCYQPGLLDAGADMEGQYVNLSFLPFEEARTNPELAKFLRAVGRDEASDTAAGAWALSLLFQQAVEKVVAKDGVNGLTRKALFSALDTFHAFDANGMYGAVDVAGRVPSACYVLMQVRNGKFVRVTPSKPGTFDCKARNLEEIQVDLHKS